MPQRPPRPWTPKHGPDRIELYRDLGLSVTICIAAHAIADNCLITVSDRRLSFDDVVEASDEAVLKASGISNTWGLLYSASDSAMVPALIEAISERLPRSDEEYSRQAVKTAVRGAWWETVNQRVADRYLASHGYHTVKEFRQKGLAELGVERFGEIPRSRSDFNPGLSLIVYGFDKSHNGNIFEVGAGSGRDLITDEGELMGYAIIGSGYWPARAYLAPRRVAHMHATTMIHRCCEAKFAAESAAGVGRATTVMIFRPPIREGGRYRIRQLPFSEIDRLREMWRQDRERPVPVEAEQIIQAKLYAGDFME